MTFVRDLYRPMARGLARDLITTGGVGSDIITSIFADGTDGFYFDFSKTDRLFQTTTGGALADDAGENIALGLEGSKWGGRTLAQELAQQAELVSNGGFDADASWTKNAATTISGGSASYSGAATNNDLVTQNIAVVSGRTYSVTYTLSLLTGGVSARIGTVNGAFYTTTGTRTEYIVAAATGSVAFAILGRGAGVSQATIDNISVKEIPGNHGLQATAAAQPKYQTGGVARFDGVDDNLLSALVPGAAMTLAFRGIMPSVGSTKIIMGAGSSSGACYLGLRLETASTVLCAGVGSQPTTTIKAAANIGGTTGTGALVVDGSVVQLFWEGAKVYEAAQVGAIGTDIAVRLGSLNGSTGTASLFVNADISKALAIKKALTAAQIAAITNLWGTS